MDLYKIFDGKTLKGWDGDTTYWRVENGNLLERLRQASEDEFIYMGGV